MTRFQDILSFQRGGVLFLKGLFFLLPLLSVTINRSLPVLLALLCCAGVCWLCYHKRSFSWVWNFSLISLGFFLAWIGISCAWSNEASASLWNAVRLMTLCGAGVFLWEISAQLDTGDTQALVRCAAWGFIPTLIWLAIEIATQGALWEALKGEEGRSLIVYSAGSTVLVLLVWPLFAHLVPSQKRKYFFTGGCVVFAFFLKTLYSHTAFYAFISSIFVFLCAYFFKRHIIVPFILVLSIVFMGAPQLTSRFLDPVKIENVLPAQSSKLSYLHRVYIWNYVAHRVYQKPYIGWGFDASGQKTLKQGLLWGSEKYNFNKCYNKPITGCLSETLPLHPHNSPLQIWLELGAVGALLWTIFLATLLWQLGHMAVSRWSFACAAASMNAAFFIGATSYGAWQSWWVSALFLTAILFQLSFDQDKKRASL